MAISTTNEPIILDSTGQSIAEKLHGIADTMTGETTDFSELNVNANIESFPPLLDSTGEMIYNALDRVHDGVTELVSDISAQATTAAQMIEKSAGTKADVITETASGSIVSFSNGADNLPVKSLTVNLEHQQDLHGYDKPWPGGGGKNILQMVAPSAGRDISFSLNNDGSLHVSGTATADATFYINGSTYDSNNTAEIPAGTYTAFCQTFMTNGNENTRVTFNGKNANETNPASSTLLARANGTRNTLTFTTAEPFKAALYLFIASGEVCNFDIKVQLEEGSTATAFAPYSNICPISGGTGANLQRTGKNLIQNKKVSYINTIYVGVDTLPANQYDTCSVILPAGTYTFSVETADGTNTNLYVAKAAGIFSYFARVTGGKILTFSISETTALRLWVYKNDYSTVGADAITQFQLERGSTATDYEPYQGETVEVTFPSSAGDNGTVYGGTLTINPDRTGTLVVDHAMVDMGALTWVYDTTTLSGTSVFKADVANRALGSKNFISSQYKNTGASRQSLVGTNGCIATWNDTSSRTVGVTDSRYSDAAMFKAAVNGVQLAYEISNPVTYALTASEISAILTTLYGTNIIWSDAGDITVEYPVDTKLYIQQLTKPTEDDMTADNAIATGTFFMIGNTLYLATAQIAAGATITPGTNATKLSLADALNQLNA